MDNSEELKEKRDVEGIVFKVVDWLTKIAVISIVAFVFVWNMFFATGARSSEAAVIEEVYYNTQQGSAIARVRVDSIGKTFELDVSDDFREYFGTDAEKLPCTATVAEVRFPCGDKDYELVRLDKANTVESVLNE